MVNSEDIHDRVILGGLLVLMYGCARLSDGQRAARIILDVDMAGGESMVGADGYVELQVLNHKTARSERLKRTYLPVVCPIFSLANVDWFRTWVQAREAAGLVVDGRLECPFIPRFGVDGKPLMQEVSSAEVGKILRAALGLEDQKHNTIRGHSLKCTPLSWCSKFGIPLDTRRLLGHHLAPGAVSSETYSRDSMGPAVRELVNVLTAIKAGTFFPDQTRSGRFGREFQTEVPEQEECAGHVTEDDAEPRAETDSEYVPGQSDSSASDSADDEKPESRLWNIVSPPLRPRTVPTPDGAQVHRHLISGVQHIQVEHNEKLACGRRLNSRYVRYVGAIVADVPLCETCSLHCK